MRVIAGRASGVPLVAPPGLVTRPTSDLLRGAIFNMLAPLEPFGRVLDLYAGTGALGIEALSRGAQHATFVERHHRACQSIRRNLEATGFAGEADVVCAPLPAALSRLAGPFELVLLDAPYDLGVTPDVLRRLTEGDLLAPRAVLVAEHRAGDGPPEAVGTWRVWKRRRQGDGAVALYRRDEEAAAAPGGGSSMAQGVVPTAG